MQKEFSDYKGTVCPRELINLRNQIFPFGPNLYREQSTARACASTLSAEMKTQLSLGHHHLLYGQSTFMSETLDEPSSGKKMVFHEV